MSGGSESPTATTPASTGCGKAIVYTAVGWSGWDANSTVTPSWKETPRGYSADSSMCAPAAIPLVLFAVSAAATTAATVQQAQQASNAAKEQNAKYRSVSDAATINYYENLKQLAIQGDQENAALSQAGQQVAASATAARGTVQARAAAAGISGVSVEALLGEFSAIEAASNADLSRNREWAGMARADTARSLRANMQQQLSSAAPNRIYGPSVGGYLASMAGQAASAYSMYRANVPPYSSSSPTLPSAGTGGNLNERLGWGGYW